MKKLLFVVLAIALMIAPVAAFAEADPEATVTVALTTITENMDYMIQSTANGAGIFQMMYDELIDMNFDTAELIPGLATDWEISEDGKTWHFTLREGVTFHDGEPLTAADVKYTYERMLDDNYNIGNTNYLNNQILFDSIDIIDDYHFDFHTKEPVPALLYSLQEVHILPEHVYANRTPEEAATLPPVGSGAFIYKDSAKEDFISMERNDNYWGIMPQFKTLVYRQIGEASTRVAELETGGIDVAQQIPMAQISTVNESGVATVKAITNGCRMYFGFNHDNPKFPLNVRMAMNHAIDWEAINQSFFFGMAPRMVVNVNEPWLNHDLEAYPYDPEKAAAFMEAEGYALNENGKWAKDGEELSFNIMVYYEQTSERYEVLLSLVDMLNKFGFTAEPYYLDRAAAVEKLDKREIDDMFYISSCTSYEPQGDLTDLKADSGSNYGRWNNPEFEDLMNQLLVEFDIDKRAEISNKMQEVIYNEAAIVPLYIMIDVWGVSDKLDWNPSPTGRAWMKKAVKYN